jgi:Protein of unknown function (DUF3300)
MSEGRPFTGEGLVMKKKINRSQLGREITRSLLALLCAAMLLQAETFALDAPMQQAAATDQSAAPLTPDQLDSLVAPIALYPDPLLAQTLAASTYPLELIQLQQWLMKNPGLKDKALEDAVAKEPWDPSVQSMAALPDVVKRLADDIQWTTDLGNAFLAQQNDVMDAVQRMRAKAQGTGNLKSNEQQKVDTKTVDNKTVIIVEQANPQVVYVPTYSPTVVYGPPVYPYPPIYYPPPGYYAAGMAISFGVGLAIGAAWGGGWGYNCGWGGGGHNNITINNNNNFVRNTNVNRNTNNINRGGGGNNWQHNPQHRGGAPYGDRNTANKFGGTSRGSSVSDRQANARQNQGQGNNRQQGGAGDRGGAGGRQQQPGVSNRAAGGAGGSGNRAGGSSDRIGNQRVSPSTSGSRGGAFGGASSGQSGGAARSSSQRGSSSMGGGGRSRGGGGGGRRR